MHSQFVFCGALVCSIWTFATSASSQNLKVDEALSKILPNSDIGWELVVDGLEFTDDACSDADGKKQIVAIDLKTESVEILAENIAPNDLVVDRKGNVYVTVTGKGEVVLISGPGKARTVATGIIAPNGITLTPDGGTLAVSEYQGPHVWTFRALEDGSLDAGERFMALRIPNGRKDSGGDGRQWMSRGVTT